MFQSTGLMSMQMPYPGMSGRFIQYRAHSGRIFPGQSNFEELLCVGGGRSGRPRPNQGGTVFPPREEGSVNVGDAHSQC